MVVQLIRWCRPAGMLAWLLLSSLALAAPPLPRASPSATIRTLDVPVIPDNVYAALEPWQDINGAQLWGWWGDELLITARAGETHQLHGVRSALGMRRQLSFLKEPVAAVFAPSSTRAGGVVLLVDQGGSEFYQLLWYDMVSGTTRLLTDGRSRHGQVVWKKDASGFAYSTTERNGRDTDIHLQDPEGHETVLLARDGETLGAEDFSKDGRSLLLISYVSTNQGELLVLDPESGATRSLAPAAGKSVRLARFGVDTNRVTFIGQIDSDFAHLHQLDQASGEIRDLTPALNADVERFEVSPDGETIAYVVNDEGYSRLWLTGSEPVTAAGQPPGVITGLSFSPDGSRVAFAINGSLSPGDVYVRTLVKQNRAASAIERWTRTEMGGIHESSLSDAELIRYPTFDEVGGKRRNIPAFLYKPAGRGPYPVLILVHGGPESQHRPQFSTLVQSLVSTLDLAVVAPNVRGSDGYGQAWLDSDNGVLREDSVRDIGALLDWIRGRQEFRADRVAVLGASYGGYMTLASLIHFGDRLRAGIDRVGISNFVTFLENTQPYRRDLRRVEYGDERDPVMRKHLQEISPLTHVDRLRTPMLISHGTNDPRVPVSESLRIRSALAERNVPVWYVEARDEGHGFRKKANIDYQAAVTWLFLKEHLTSGEE